MDIFYLPDLGEGLPDAEIHTWFVQEGDTVTLDQPLVSMETAKAVVDVPAPQNGIIAKLYGKAGDVIKTGEPLLAFVSEQARPDQGTVVGNLEESKDTSVDHFTIGALPGTTTRPKATPHVRLLAKKLGVDLTKIQGSGDHGVITKHDVEHAAQDSNVASSLSFVACNPGFDAELPAGFEPLHGIRRAMLTSMRQAHAEVVPVTIFDEADIDAWQHETDITVRLIRALITACQQEPTLNAWFDSKHSALKCFKEINLGLAMDNTEGLFVPVIHDVTRYSDEDLRKCINEYKQLVAERTIPADQLKGATITLSNFGKFAGRFASPIIVPPTVAILAVGRLYEGVVAYQGQPAVHRLLPLSLSFDHRIITGGEATRFLGAVIAALEKA